MNRSRQFLRPLLCLLFVGVALVAMAPVEAQAGTDKDCSDFPNQAAAQSFFISAGGPGSDPHGLDADHDGIACESLPCPCSGGNPDPDPDPAIVNLTLPTISGSATVGQTLTSTLGTWDPDSVHLTRQWYTNTGRIEGATGATYVLTAAEIGKVIKVRVMATMAGYTSAAAVSAGTAVVTEPQVLNVTLPSIEGAPAVGETLTANTGSWNPADAAVFVQWFSGQDPIDGATATTYIVQPAEAGTTMHIEVTAMKIGYLSGKATSDETALIDGPDILSTAPPALSGKPRVGKVLRTTPGEWTPVGVALSFAWLRDGRMIRRATDSSTYRLTRADVGHRISVRVAASAVGYDSAAATSNATRRVRKPKP